MWRQYVRAMGGRRTLPDFCVIGPPKSGTSDLAVSILMHPNVLTPISKEIWDPNPETWRLAYPTEREKRRHAERHGIALSPYLTPCLHWLAYPHMLSQARPNTKIVITLRNPAERVFSQWKWEVLFSGKTRASALPFLSTFASYVDMSLQLYPEYPMYTACGFGALQTSIYWRAVTVWIERFGAQNVLILDTAEYFQDPDSTLRRIQEFVGLPYVQIPTFGAKVNENPIRSPPADEHSMSRLREFFRPANERLWEVIGQRWNWE